MDLLYAFTIYLNDFQCNQLTPFPVTELLDQFDLLLRDHQHELFTKLNDEVAAVYERQIFGISEQYKNRLLGTLSLLENPRKVVILVSNQRKQIVLLKNRLFWHNSKEAL